MDENENQGAQPQPNVGEFGEQLAGWRCQEVIRQSSFLLAWSMATAIRITSPFITCCQKGDTSSKTRPLFSTPMMRQPRTVPKIEPRPPESEVPPMTTAAIESNS